MQHALRHHDSGLTTASLPTTALDLFHFSAMRRLLHNSGKCLMPEAALDLFAGSMVQHAMAAELGTSFQSTSLQVSTQQVSHITTFLIICLPQRHAAHCLTLVLLFSDSLVPSRKALLTCSLLLTSITELCQSTRQILLVSVVLCCSQGVAPATDADLQSTESLADGSTTGTSEPTVAARSSVPARPWSSAVQHSSPSHEADANVKSSPHVSNEQSSNNSAYGRPNFLFTSVPMLGPPVQPADDPVAPNTAAGAESEGDIVQSCDKFAKMSIVTASAKKRTLKTLTFNSLSLAAAIEEAGEATAAVTAPDPDDSVSLVRLQ